MDLLLALRIPWNMLFPLERLRNLQNHWGVKKTMLNFRNYPMDGAICMMPRRSLCGQRIVLDDSFQTLTLMNHGVDFRKEMHGSIRSMFRMSHKNWLNSLERICSISGWIVSLRCRRRMCLEVVHKLTPSQGLKVFIITVINRTCISLGCSIFLVDLI